MTKVRGFSIVIHNVHPDCRDSAEKHFRALNPLKLIVALEPYPEQEGFHIHIFIKFTHTRSFKSFLDATIQFSKHIVLPKPEDEIRDWGRVECDQLRGSFEQATSYLVNPTKDKPTDPLAKPHSKGDRTCDVCGTTHHWVNMAADYPDRQTGRCRKCILVPHRLLTNLGHDVRNLDSYLEIWRA